MHEWMKGGTGLEDVSLHMCLHSQFNLQSYTLSYRYV